MTNTRPKKILTHEIMKFVQPLQKGRALDPTEAVACAKLILGLENERRKLEVLANSASSTVDAREQSWQEVYVAQMKEITTLRNANKDMAQQMKRFASNLISAAEKHQVEATQSDRRRKPLQP